MAATLASFGPRTACGALSGGPAGPALATGQPLGDPSQLSSALNGLSTTAWHSVSQLSTAKQWPPSPTHPALQSHPTLRQLLLTLPPGSGISASFFCILSPNLSGGSYFQFTNLWVSSPSLFSSFQPINSLYSVTSV